MHYYYKLTLWKCEKHKWQQKLKCMVIKLDKKTIHSTKDKNESKMWFPTVIHLSI